jgi:tetratricopeptide (TPR) repeat protein
VQGTKIMSNENMSNQEHREPGPAETIVRFELGKNAFPTSRMLFDYADALRQVGRHKEALQKYAELTAETLPEDKVWLVALFKGETFLEMGKFSEAEQAFRDACHLELSTVPRVYLAASLAAQERFEEAIIVLSDALHCEGDHDEVLLNLALNQRTLGQLEAAQKNLESALTITPDYTSARVALEDISAALSIERRLSKEHP